MSYFERTLGYNRIMYRMIQNTRTILKNVVGEITWDIHVNNFFTFAAVSELKTC
jgi:hypothetical protein